MGYPPLQLMIDSLNLVSRELGAMANLTVAVADYGTLNATIDGWRPETTVTSLRAIAASTEALHAARVELLLAELERMATSLSSIGCLDALLQTLGVLNTSLLQLPPDSQLLAEQGEALRTALRALPEVGQFTRSAEAAQARLGLLPAATDYLLAVEDVDAAIVALPAGAPLTTALGEVQAVAGLPADHGWLVNSSAALREAIEALPPTAPVLRGFAALNRSRDALPPLIDAALAAIAYYDETGDDSDMSSIGRATEELQLLLEQVRAPPPLLPLPPPCTHTHTYTHTHTHRVKSQI